MHACLVFRRDAETLLHTAAQAVRSRASAFLDTIRHRLSGIPALNEPVTLLRIVSIVFPVFAIVLIGWAGVAALLLERRVRAEAANRCPATIPA